MKPETAPMRHMLSVGRGLSVKLCREHAQGHLYLFLTFGTLTGSSPLTANIRWKRCISLMSHYIKFLKSYTIEIKAYMLPISKTFS